MIKFDIRDLVTRNRPAKGTEVIFDPVFGTLRAKNQYRKAARAFLNGAAKSYRESVLPALKFYREYATDAEVDTFDEEAWFIGFEVQLDQLESEFSATIATVLTLEAETHTAAWSRVAKRALGVDLGAVVRNEDLGDYLRDAATRNAGLIKSLRGDVTDDVRRLVLDAKINGTSIKQLTAQIQKRFKVALTRAKLIAEDQTNKLTSDLNRIRQTQAGVKSYHWQTSGNERVRPLHNAINGLLYRWGQRTGAEGGLPPGQPIRCRCSARAVVVF